MMSRLLKIGLLYLLLASCALEDGQIAGMCRVEPVFDAPPLNACKGTRRVRLTIVGDVLLHGQLQRIGYAGGFPAMWAQATPFVRAADIAVANLEGPVAPGVTRSGTQRADPGPVFDDRVYTSYPMFNYHPMVLPALRDAGFDLVTTANNHAMDRRSLGADLTLEQIELAGIGAVGTIRSGAARDFVWRQRSTLGNIAFIACSFSTNGISDPQHQVLMCYRDQPELLALVRQEAADPSVAAVIVLPHWGQEYQSHPDASQTALARALVAAGATVVVGSHPHAVQPFTQMTGPDGQAVPVAYSTGNFVAGQNWMPAKVGALAIVDLCRGDSGVVADRFGWVAAQMEFTQQAFGLNIAPRDTEGPLGLAYRHMSAVAPGYSAQPQSCAP